MKDTAPRDSINTELVLCGLMGDRALEPCVSDPGVPLPSSALCIVASMPAGRYKSIGPTSILVPECRVEVIMVRLMTWSRRRLTLPPVVRGVSERAMCSSEFGVVV